MTVGELLAQLEPLPRDARLVVTPVFLTEDGVWHEKVLDADRPDAFKDIVDVNTIFTAEDNEVVLGVAEGYAGYHAADNPGGL